MLTASAIRCRWSLLVIGLLAVSGGTRGVPALGELGQSCVNPARQPGKCVYIRECPPLTAILLNRNRTAADTHFLLNSHCTIVQQKPVVCCADQHRATDLPAPPVCGLQLTDRVVGGEVTDLEEFPWVALIEYAKQDGGYAFHCGGSIINERYILTAAHCVTSLPHGWKIHRVRLGEWDLHTDPDCEEEEVNHCNAPAVDMDIEQIITHNRYDPRDASKANDIALIRLAQVVPYSDTIRPICLPVSERVRHMNHEGTMSYAAGWGKTEQDSQSNRKLKVNLTINDLAGCQPAYQRSGILLKPTHLCAGGERGKDTCTGDSGGPLMRQFAGAWHLLGVVSFGSSKCGASGVSGIYVNVPQYIDWIQKNIK